VKPKRQSGNIRGVTAFPIAALLFAGVANAAVYDAGPAELAEALRKLQPGDTLILEDGIYPKIHLRDRHGGRGQHITIRARNERRAFIRGDGDGAALLLHRSSWWAIEGLRIENADNEAFRDRRGKIESDSFAAIVSIGASEHIVLRRCLLRNPNRWGNNQGVDVSNGSRYCLIEENELYDFHRNGYSAHGLETQHNIFRRNYANSRSTPRLGRSWGPNDAYVMYGGASNILENNIAEFSRPDGICFANWGQNNRLYGNIALGGTRGFIVVQKDSTPRFVGDGCRLVDNLAIGQTIHGFLTGSVLDVTIANGTAIGAGQAGIQLADLRPGKRAIPAPPAVTMINMLAVGNSGYGVSMREPERLTLCCVRRSAGWANGGGTWSPNGHFREPVEVGSILDWTMPTRIPEQSALKGAGVNGADIGANIVFRYDNGVLTDQPLWDAEGAFPRGTVIGGVNDHPGAALFDLHTRLTLALPASQSAARDPN
jgi:hypothetical protein